jgi:riboflavin synthase
MFTGIIQAVGSITHLEARGGDVRLRIRTGKLDLADVRLGDSIAVNGVCLTAVDLPGDGFAADVATRLGGHLVSGHVDGMGRVVERRDDARSLRFAIEAPAPLARYIAHKGSICVDGTSLTVNAVNGARFDLNIVPHTLQETIFAGYAPGTRVNLEVDLVARYLERLLLGERAAEPGAEASGVTMELLARAGFLG